jgi:hypothetical protein
MGGRPMFVDSVQTIDRDERTRPARAARADG